MAKKSFLSIFLILSSLLLRHSTGDGNRHRYRCPESFKCGALGPIKFPLSDATHPLCGLCMVNCSKKPVPELDLGREQRYDVKEYLKDEAVKVRDNWQGNLITSKNCDLFSRWIVPPPSSSISFTISPSLTVYKCNNISRELRRQAEDYFRGNYSSYGVCLGYTIYYTYPANHSQIPISPDDLPKNCVVLELPVVPPNGKRNASDLISLLAEEFSIGLNVSNECRECRLKGGQCPRDTPKFQCLKEKGGRLNLKLILGTAAPGIGIFVFLLFCIIRKLSQSKSIVFWKNKTESYQNVEAFIKNYGSLFPKRYTYSDIKRMTNSFKAKLGQGGYGCVFKGKLENGHLVAVKVLKGLKGSGEEFINEVATISRTSHVNIVTLLGFCFEGRSRALIYEFMPNGSLEKFIYDRNSLTHSQLGWEALYQISVGIARGLEYLHRGCNMRIVHFDIKPHNILLDEEFCPKISDFGLAKLCPQKESIISMSGTRGTAGYIAPEVFSRNFGVVSHKSDVYSYGMMILEMVGGRKNSEVEVDRTSEIYFPHWIYKRLELDEELGLHGIMHDDANESARKMIIVGLWCIQTDPSHRPSMSKVVEMLKGSLESLQIPPKPFLSSPSRSPSDSSTTLMS